MLGASREADLRVRVAAMQGLLKRMQALEQSMEELRQERSQVLEQLVRDLGTYLAEQNKF